MLRSLLVLPDGSEIFSGAPGRAILSAEVTARVNAGTDLAPGTVCAQMLKLRLIAPEGPGLTAGQEVTLYRVADDGARQQEGLFTVEKPEAKGGAVYEITAYDRVSRLDRDLTDWLAAQTAWPIGLRDFADQVCAACGVEAAPGTLPGGSYQIPRFTAGAVTGRQLIGWAAQLAGRFCLADPQGRLVFDWYGDTPVYIGPGGVGKVGVRKDILTLPGRVDAHTLTVTELQSRWEADALCLDAPLWYFQGSASFADYVVAPVERIRLSGTEKDVGTVYPDTAEAVNTYRITANPLLSQQGAGDLEEVAKSLHSLLKDIRYTPCKLNLPADAPIRPGGMLKIRTPGGRLLTAYAMSLTRKGGILTVECTGNPNRQTSAAVNEASYRSLSGRVLELTADVEGMQVENRAASGELAALRLDVSGIRANVSRQEGTVEALTTRVSTLTQTAGELAVEVKTVREQGVSKVVTGMGYSFSDEGLRIRNPREAMENCLDNTGMFVRRGDQTILRADQAGVLATDVAVGNFLQVGDHARLEDYDGGAGEKRTACYFI